MRDIAGAEAPLRSLLPVTPVILAAALSGRTLLHKTKDVLRWVADPDEIVAAIRRGYQALDSIH
jgi:hypothetical protein